MDTFHQLLAEIGLRAAARFGFALAGGYAVQAHQFLTRPSEDVDLFTAWERRSDFTAAVDAVVAAYRTHGYTAEVTQQFVTFARLAVTDPDVPDRTAKVEMAANWRAQPPVILEIGPVLHPDDVAAGKMSALYSRAEPRDFLDVDATSFRTLAAIPPEHRSQQVRERLDDAITYLGIHRLYKKSRADQPLFRHLTQFFLTGDYRSDLLDMLQGVADADPELARRAWVRAAVHDMDASTRDGLVDLVKNYGRKLIDPIPFEPVGEPSRFLTHQWIRIRRTLEPALG